MEKKLPADSSQIRASQDMNGADSLKHPMNNRLVIENQGRRVVELNDTATIQYFYDNVRAVQDSTYFFADSAIMTVAFFSASGHVTILQPDTIQLFSDSLYYSNDSSIVELYDSVIFINGSQEIAASVLYYDIDSRVAHYQDTAILTQRGYKLQSIRGRYLAKEKISYFYDDVILKGEDISLRTDSMYVLNNEGKVVFLGPTRIKTTDAQIYCESGYYYMDTRVGEFSQNAQYVSNDRKVKGDKIIYNDQNKEVTVEGNTSFLTSDGLGNSESIYYSEETSDLILEGNATYHTTDKNLRGQRIVYNDQTGEVFIAGAGKLQKNETIIEASNIDYNEKTGMGLADGDVVYQDTSTHTTIRSDIMNINTLLNASRFYNYQCKPLLEKMMGTDTMFLSCDTLITFEIMDTLGNTYPFLIADNNVKILKSDIQAVADSMIYFATDSIFKLIDRPMMWSDSTQFNADTIHLILKDDKVGRMKMINNSFIINTNDLQFFNQIKGKVINAFFVEDDLDNFVVEGNAQSIYYVLDDDDAYVGVNTTECSILKFYFGNNEISDIKGYTDVKQKMIPMKKVDHQALRLEGFQWDLSRKPKTLADLEK